MYGELVRASHQLIIRQSELIMSQMIIKQADKEPQFSGIRQVCWLYEYTDTDKGAQV